jgi:hypothetical protein
MGPEDGFPPIKVGGQEMNSAHKFMAQAQDEMDVNMPAPAPEVNINFQSDDFPSLGDTMKK